jgi:orsellinic acid C2-O-methyltransferase
MQHPGEAAVFNAAMAENTRRTARAIAAAYDFLRFRRLVDVGGGNDTLIAAILAAAPGLRGIRFETSGKPLIERLSWSVIDPGCVKTRCLL